ncbi:tetratricopeptide repeat protein [Sinomicrobium weinanense]|uniref:Tetratricopeptide repeat protein n=1 Tax=Sinomicrobium weinanense TaxID=2842200 RepID=A0A926Q3B8_9FLAO|nr:tetratricopeptide repeat protein [Sinomicrobium weinanense]MBC9796749.1 tetratricopeptide repeat protein [Sinomicrobium weinanense]MBU3124020.1 tetratricopeptide repeat protein [Sinomicrobium weinanense]
MKVIGLLLCLLFGFQVFAQKDILAKQYFDEGEFEKALAIYEKLYEESPRTNYLGLLVECYQQLERYGEAEAVLLKKINGRVSSPVYFVELGYNYALQGKKGKSREYYDKALKAIEDRTAYTYSVGRSFQDKNLLDEAIAAYEKGKELDPRLMVDYQVAQLYGEKGDMEKMYNSLLDLIASRKNFNLSNVQQIIARFITDDASHPNNVLLRKLVLKRAQSTPDVLWNELLSWLFIRQRQYASAFTQEKAIFKRAEVVTLQPVIDLGVLAMNDGDDETATAVFEFVIENTGTVSVLLQAHLNILQIQTEKGDAGAHKQIDNKFRTLLEEYGTNTNTLNVQIAYARFQAFQKEDTDRARAILKQSLDLSLDPLGEARVKMAYADVLVYSEKFNQALIYYSQVQKMVKNDVIAQQARFKVAQTSFYKGDFDWALTQLKVLRESASQLIANDAMQLSLLISDNMLEDSIQAALKTYARADLYAYQNKNEKAVALLDTILTSHKGESIEDEALFRQAGLFEKQQHYEKAEYNYLKIIEFYPYDILMDDALFALARLYEYRLDEPEKALPYYEKIIFEHQDSIYFVEARKAYRKLRGDGA